MTGSLAGHHILLTGGGSGIGRAAAEAYLGQGASVTVLERSPEHARELSAGSRDLRVEVGDATDPEALACAVERARGPAGLDHLTCCVGVFDQYAALASMSVEQLTFAAEEMYRTNVTSALLAIRVALADLRAAHGSVTLTLSESAFHPVGGGVLYATSKWALRGAVVHLAAELAPEVRVNGVAPGGTTGTKFGGLGALGQTGTADRVEGRDERIAAGTVLGVTPRPEDHAGAYVYLADPRAARVTTGVVIPTDGGRRA
jgi:NAD(P)-dependent dehydrogenase (short-subunit alcohol dehydrogenase family)